MESGLLLRIEMRTGKGSATYTLLEIAVAFEERHADAPDSKSDILKIDFLLLRLSIVKRCTCGIRFLAKGLKFDDGDKHLDISLRISILLISLSPWCKT